MLTGLDMKKARRQSLEILLGVLRAIVDNFLSNICILQRNLES